MAELFNITLEDDDGNVILPQNPRENGNAFAVCHLPRKGDEVQVNDTSWTVIDVIHRLHETHPTDISLRLRAKSLELDE
jgi:hypothetical protein